MTRKNEAVWIESRQRWQINVQSDGERRTFTSSTPFVPGKKTQPGKIEAEKKADKWIEERLIDENVRIEKMLDKWYEHLKISTSEAYYKQYDSYIRNWIKPAIGTIRMSRLTKNDIQSVIDIAYSKGKLSDKTLRNIRGCLMTFLVYCRNANITKLYIDRLNIPKGAAKSAKTIATPDELKKLFASSVTAYRGHKTEDFFIHAYRFAVLTGMRPGELLGLRNENINGDIVTITQSLNSRNKFTHGKNDNARRTYKLGELARKELADQRVMLVKHGMISPCVFPTERSEFISQKHFRGAWYRYCTANGFKTKLTPYELRHTFVSVNVEMPEALKKMIIGHSANMDTEGHYGHKKQGDMDLAAEYIDKAFKQYIG